MINSSVYLFGQLGKGFTQFPDNYAREMFQHIVAAARAKSQIVIHREGNLMYYAYVRHLADRPQCIGLCVLLNSLMFADVNCLFALFERAVAKLVASGSIIAFNEEGNIVPVTASLTANVQDAAALVEMIRQEANALEPTTRQLPPVSYALSNMERKTLVYNTPNEDIVDAASKYAYTCVKKPAGYDHISIAGFRGLIRKLNGEKSRLAAEIGMLKNRIEELKKAERRKGHIGFILVLCLLTGGLAIGMNHFYQELKETQEELSTSQEQYDTMRHILQERQPMFIRSTAFDYDTGRLRFEYFGIVPKNVKLTLKVFGNGETYTRSEEFAIMEGKHSGSIRLGSKPVSRKWYSFELLIGNKIIGGDRH